MTYKEIITKAQDLLDDAKCAVLATISQQNRPGLRWMSPSFLPEHDNLLYAVTSANFNKAHDIQANPLVTWMIQKKDLTEVVSIEGRINIIDNPSLKAQVIEKIGNKLTVFWKLKGDDSDFIVLETIIERVRYFKPMSSEKFDAEAKEN